jgi:hypothetical protein
MNNYQIDVWENYKQAGYQNFENILLVIKEGKFKSEITEIRNFLKENNKNKSDRLKNSLSGFTVSAIFDEKRQKERVIKYYGVMVLDIDNLKDEEEVERIKKEIEKIEYTKMVFVSPSGLGLKIIVETNNTDVERHTEVYKELVNYYGNQLNVEFDKFDSQTCDVSRLCFFSYDETAYYNCESKIFISEKDIKKEKKMMENKVISNDGKYNKVIEEIIEFTKRKQRYVKGNRNRFVYLLVKNSKLGGVPEEIIREFCINNYVEEDFPVEEIESIMEVYNDDEIKFGKYKYIYRKLLK